MAIGNSLNPDCTVRACRTPRLFMSILAKRLHPAVAAARTACRASLRCENHWPACHEPERAPRETGISLDEHVTSLVLHWSIIPPSWTSMKSDNVRVIRAANKVCRRTTERGKVLNPEYSLFRDQPIPGASPLRINTLLSRVLWSGKQFFALPLP